MKTNLLTRVLGCAIFIFAAQAQAAYVWLDKESGTVKAYLGELHANKGSPAVLAGARAYQPGGRDLGLASEAAGGTIKPPVSFPGLYVLDVSVKVNGAVTVDGKKYDDVRHTARLSFIADGANK